MIREVKLIYGDVVCDSPTKMSGSDAAYRLFRHLKDLPIEQFWVAILNARHEVINTSMVSSGTLTSSLVHPREVFQAAIMVSGAAIIVVHNHPSGDCTPSQEDVDVTDRLTKAGKLLGIPLLDHLVIGSDGYHSIPNDLFYRRNQA